MNYLLNENKLPQYFMLSDQNEFMQPANRPTGFVSGLIQVIKQGLGKIVSYVTFLIFIP